MTPPSHSSPPSPPNRRIRNDLEHQRQTRPRHGRHLRYRARHRRPTRQQRRTSRNHTSRTLATARNGADELAADTAAEVEPAKLDLSSIPERDIVLVRADSGEEVRLAFRNYFADAAYFIDLLDSGCQRLLEV